MTERDENIIAGIIVSSLLDYASKERLIEAMRADAEASRLSSAVSPREEPTMEPDVFAMAALLLKDAGYHASHRVFVAAIERLKAASVHLSPEGQEKKK